MCVLAAAGGSVATGAGRPVTLVIQGGRITASVLNWLVHCAYIIVELINIET